MQDLEHGCLDKVRHENYMKARNASVKLSINTGDKFVEPYYCHHCKGYHVGRAIGYHRKKREARNPNPKPVLSESQEKSLAYMEYQRKHKCNPPKGWDWKKGEAI
jgi:hypothetical protein